MNDHRWGYVLVLALLAALTAFSTMVAQGAIPQIPKDYAWVGAILGIFVAAITTRLPPWNSPEPPTNPPIIHFTTGSPVAAPTIATTSSPTTDPPPPPLT